MKIYKKNLNFETIIQLHMKPIQTWENAMLE